MKKICVSAFVLLLGLAIYTPSVKADQSFQFLMPSPLPTATFGQKYTASIIFVYSGIGIPSATDTGFPPGIMANPIITTSPGYYSINISGIPTQAGVFTISVVLNDQYGGATLSQTFPLTVNYGSSNGNGFGLVNNPLPTGTVGISYDTIIGFNYYGSLTPTAVIAGLPNGMTTTTPVYVTPGSGFLYNYSLNLSGTPTAAGSYNLSLTLNDGQIYNKYNIPLVINAAATAPTSPVTTNPTPTTPTPQQVVTTPAVNANSSPVTDTDPAGTNIISNGIVYMITTDGQKRPYTSAGAFLSYGFNSWSNVIVPNPADLALPTGNFIPPRDGKIICSNKGSDMGTCYLITDGQKAAFTSSAVFTGLGFSFSNSLSGDVSFLVSAPNITSASQAHPAGVLINKAGTIYLVGDNGLLGVPDMATLNSWGYSVNDSVPANSADSVLPQNGVMAAHTAGALSPFGN